MVVYSDHLDISDLRPIEDPWSIHIYPIQAPRLRAKGWNIHLYDIAQINQFVIRIFNLDPNTLVIVGSNRYDGQKSYLEREVD